MNLPGRLWKIAMGAFIIAIAWILVQYLWQSHERAALMDTWIEVPCTITQMDVDDSHLNQRGMTKYLMVVTYDYDFDGKKFEGTRIKRLPTEASDPRKLKKYIEAYAEGTQTVAYVNPEAPSEAVLKKDSKAALYAIWFPFVFIFGGLGMIFSALFRKS
ncbi:DUF3592 domain-containing protein [Verrucomicrobiales bacterium BCK34]|nr:DUF3592 domain-containing protein [Verrucomicrobiales bacterium BCK34]